MIHRSLNRAVLLSAASIALVFAGAVANAQGRPGTRPAPQNVPGCAKLNYKNPTYDYRLRELSNQTRRDYKDRTVNHYDRVVAVMQRRQGVPGDGLLKSLDYVLMSWPNHQPALLQVAKYFLRDGRQASYSTFDCYIKGAKAFAADDPAIPTLEGYYYQKAGELQRAVQAYQEALAIDPNSAEANYNLGLVYFSQGQYAKAKEHAVVAYGAGYPMPGLMENLKRVGHW